MSLPVYSEYKDGGVEWLGRIPNHWPTVKFRHVFEESKEKIESDIVGEMLSVSGYRGIEIKEYDDDNQKRLDEDLVGYRIVRRGQLVVNTMWLNYAGLGVSDFEGHVSPAYRSYYIDEAFDKRYLHHLMRSESFVRGYTKFLTGVRPNSLQMSRDDLMSFLLVQPPVDEQRTIANFLDIETAKIDTLIAEQEKLLLLLAEKRQATISQAVTKGLNPDAPMKDSGVEWIGIVPSHWSMAKLKSIAEFRGGGTPSRDNETYWNGDIPWVSPKDMKREWIDSAEEYITQEGLSSSTSNLIQSGSVLMVVRSGILQHTIPVAINQVPVALNQDMKAIRFASKGCLPSFFMRWVQGLNDSLLLLWRKQGATVESIEQAYLENTIFPIPELAEQEKIVAYLDSELFEFDTLFIDSKKSIDLLKERRAALISAAVTGKIDVRNYQTKEAA